MVIHREQGEVEFQYHRPHAQQVYLVGDFNDWDSSATPMLLHSNGEWRCRLALPDGIYFYKFLADGAWDLGEAAAGVDEVPFGCNNVLVLNQSSTPALPAG